MFDDVHFTGQINLGAVVVALVQLISVLTVYIRVKTLIEEKEFTLKYPFMKKKDLPPPPPVDTAKTDSTKVLDE